MNLRMGRVGALAAVIAALAAANAHAQLPNSALFNTSQPGPEAVDGDTAPVELGVRFTVSMGYLAEGVTFYRPPGFEAADSIVRLYEDGEVIKTGTIGSSPTGGWAKGWFAGGPKYLTPDHEYVASYTVVHGESYPATTGFFNERYDPMTLRMHVPPSGGVYRYIDAASGFATPPIGSFHISP